MTTNTLANMRSSNIRLFSSVFLLKLIAVFCTARLVVSLPSPSGSTNASWSTLPNSVRINILQRLDPNDVVNLMFSSKPDQALVLDYIHTDGPRMSQDRKLQFFQWAAETNNLLLFDTLMANASFYFPDSDVFMASCRKGSASIGRLFLEENPRATIPYYKMEKLKEDCLIEAARNGHTHFLKVTGIALNQPKISIGTAVDQALRSHQFLAAKYLYSLIGNEKEMALFNFLIGSCMGNTTEMAVALGSSIMTKNDFLEMNFRRLRAGRIDRDPPIFERSHVLYDPVYCASDMEQFESFRFIVELVTAGLAYKISPIRLNDIVWKGNIEMLRLLELHHIPSAFEKFESSLSCAALSGKTEVVLWVLKEAAKRGIVFGEASIAIAKSKANSTGVLEILMQRFGSDLPEDGLPFAAFLGNEANANVYIKRPAFHSYKTGTIIRAIQNAIKSHSLGIVEAILTRTWRRFGTEEINSFFILATQHRQIAIMDFLIHRCPMPANPATEDNKAFISAAEHGFVDVMEFLVSLGNNDIDPAADKNEAFVKACENNHIEAVKYLVSLQGNYPSIDPATQGNRPFRIAAYSGHIKLARYLYTLRAQFPALDGSQKLLRDFKWQF